MSTSGLEWPGTESRSFAGEIKICLLCDTGIRSIRAVLDCYAARASFLHKSHDCGAFFESFTTTFVQSVEVLAKGSIPAEKFETAVALTTWHPDIV